jgi:hypothetical protein
MAASLDRANVRTAFENRFTIERVAHDYLQMYHQLVASESDRRNFEKLVANAGAKRFTPKVLWHLVSCRVRSREGAPVPNYWSKLQTH